MENKKIHVLMLGPHYNCKGGIATVLRNYLEYQDNKDIDFDFLSVRGDSPRAIKLFQSIFGVFKLIIKLILKKYDMIHMHPSENTGFFRYIPYYYVSRCFRNKVVMHMHGGSFNEFLEKLSKFFNKRIVKVLENSSKLICLSDFWETYFNSINIWNTSVINNSVIVHQCNYYDSESKNITFLGFIEKRKGIYDLIEALKIIENEVDFTLNVCGSGEEDLLKKKIADLSLSKRVIMHGWIGPEKKDELLKNTAIFILPSYNEGLPMCVLEAMSYGIPIISTPVGGIPELVKEENGILVTPGKCAEIAEAIKELWHNIEKRKEMSEKNYNLVNDEYSMKATFDKLLSVYKEVIEQ
jgi:glycosyltransferase involved in cell wall biosynthesis